jgi:tripartite-type tricarboxylate transporter receptor subunit TctC
MKKTLLSTLCASVLLSAASFSAIAQEYPNKTITMIMPYAPGGPGDTITRLFANAMQKNIGQQIIVDNPAGASGSIGTARVARSAPDGYTLLMTHISHATNPMMIKNLSYSPVKDFEPVGLATVGPMVVVARKDLPPANTQEFVEYVKKNQDKISIGNAGVGSASHMCSLMFMEALGVKLNNIPYKGTGPAMNDLMGGQIDMAFLPMAGSIPQTIIDGKIQGLGVTAKTPHALFKQFPALATMKGLEGMDFDLWAGVQVHKNTPDAVVNTLNKAFYAAAEVPETRKALEASGNVVLPSRTPAELARIYLGDIERYRVIAKSINLEAQ